MTLRANTTNEASWLKCTWKLMSFFAQFEAFLALIVAWCTPLHFIKKQGSIVSLHWFCNSVSRRGAQRGFQIYAGGLMAKIAKNGWFYMIFNKVRGASAPKATPPDMPLVLENIWFSLAFYLGWCSSSKIYLKNQIQPFLYFPECEFIDNSAKLGLSLSL